MCNECGITYDKEDPKAVKKHSSHDFTKCPVCRQSYDASDVELHLKHTNETICKKCKAVYNMKNAEEYLVHQREIECKICSVVYDPAFEKNHNAFSHPNKRHCNKCKLVATIAVYNNEHADHDIDEKENKEEENKENKDDDGVMENYDLFADDKKTKAKPKNDAECWKITASENPSTIPTAPLITTAPPIPPPRTHVPEPPPKYIFDFEVDENSRTTKVNTDTLWTRVAKFYSDGQPSCDKYFHSQPNTNQNPNPSVPMVTTIKDGNIVRTPVSQVPPLPSVPSHLPSIPEESDADVTDYFQLGLKIMLDASIKQKFNLVLNKPVDYQLRVNCFTPLKIILAKLNHKFEYNEVDYTTRFIVHGKLWKNLDSPINTIINNRHTVIHVVVQKTSLSNVA